MNNKNTIVLVVILLLIVLALTYFFINNEAKLEDGDLLSARESSDEGYEAVETTDQIIGEIDNSLNYFE